MGAAAGDYDNDGDLDLYMTHFSDDVNTLYQNQGDGQFVDFTAAAGLGGEVRPLLGLGAREFSTTTTMAGWTLFAVNGHIYPQVAQHPSGLRYAQRNLLYQNAGGTFVEVGAAVGQGFAEEKVSRGGALGDYDNDGDLDLLGREPERRADPFAQFRWGAAAIGWGSNWSVLKVTATHRGRGLYSWRIMDSRCGKYSAGVGYLSQSDGRVLFGLGTAEEVEARRNPLAQWSGAGIGGDRRLGATWWCRRGKRALLLVMSGQRIPRIWSPASS